MPDLGGISVRLSVWYAEPGDTVLEGERLIEVVTDRAIFEIVAPATGTFPNDFLAPGQLLGVIAENNLPP
jgi:2-oxoglutarate dehydrogenase E2 component (dihydrolipoamide succinyltransferase)/2-oxoisovalerate dehydrogenase E2 component (dihydrolipoyl transacylase)